jgi:hypothetical protein
MEHHEKLQAMYRHMDALGIRRSTAAPPVWRLMWRMGWEVPPPLFLGFWPLALGTGLTFCVVWGLCMLVLDPAIPPSVTGLLAIIGGAGFGLVFAAVIRIKSIRHKLPSWSEYQGPAERT